MTAVLIAPIVPLALLMLRLRSRLAQDDRAGEGARQVVAVLGADGDADEFGHRVE